MNYLQPGCADLATRDRTVEMPGATARQIAAWLALGAQRVPDATTADAMTRMADRLYCVSHIYVHADRTAEVTP